jgi:CheY-like chemotaxis protein
MLTCKVPEDCLIFFVAKFWPLTKPNKMTADVLLVAEDNPDDAFIFQMMFTKAALPQSLHIVEDGQQVIDWLSGNSPYSDRTKYPLPSYILLDIKMPVKTGFEALEWIRSQKVFHELPVIMLSSSDDPKDKKRAYELGVTNFFVKSPRLKDVLEYLSAS